MISPPRFGGPRARAHDERRVAVAGHSGLPFSAGRAYDRNMRLLSRFRSSAQLPPGRFVQVPADGFMRVVGESHYQSALARLSRRCVPGVEGRPSFPVALIPEPDNPYDEHAVAVVSDEGRVGYLPKEDARRYGPSLRAVRARGYDGISCMGLLNGGEPDRPNFGVTLCVSYPRDCEVHVGIRGRDGKPTSGRLRGQHYTEYVEEIKRLRRSGNEEDAEGLLRELLDPIETEASALGEGVPPWYYEQLAIIARKRKDTSAELSVLERFARAPHAPGVGTKKLLERLSKVRHLASRET